MISTRSSRCIATRISHSLYDNGYARDPKIADDNVDSDGVGDDDDDDGATAALGAAAAIDRCVLLIHTQHGNTLIDTHV